MPADWLPWLLAAAMVGVAAYHVARLIATRVRHHAASMDVELTHAAMGAAMTAMLVGLVAPAADLWLALPFVAMATWFAVRGVHTYVMDGVTPRAVAAAWQVVGCAAMAYMLLAVVRSATTTHMAGMVMGGNGRSDVSWPGLRLLLVGATVAWAGWTMFRVVDGRSTSAGAGRVGLSAGCQLAMNMTTVYMLVAM